VDVPLQHLHTIHIVKGKGQKLDLAMKFTATTDPNLILKTLQNSYAEFGAPFLTLDQYLDRERFLAEQTFAKRLTCWVLLSDEGDVLSACETYRRPCMVRINDKVLHGDCMAVASVVTPIHHRKKGYATQMLKSLQTEIRSMEGVIASSLYSDIGPEFYDRMGWKCYESVSLMYEAKHCPVALKEMEELELTHLAKLLEEDLTELNQSLAEKEFVVLPTIDALEWLAARSKYYARIKDPRKVPSIFGAKVDTDYISWMYDFKGSVLAITHFRGCHHQNCEKLLQFAALVAYEWNLANVEIWDPSPLLLHSAKCVGGHVTYRSESLSSLQILGHDQVPITWKWNEKYGWV
jgi:hypothetical protein